MTPLLLSTDGHPPYTLTLRLPYSLKVAHSSVVSAVLAAEELVPHTLLLSELITWTKMLMSQRISGCDSLSKFSKSLRMLLD